MALTKKPTLVKKKIAKNDKAADTFAAAAASHTNNQPTGPLEFERLTLRFERNLLASIDRLVKIDADEHHVPENRNGYIVKVMREVVKRGGLAS